MNELVLLADNINCNGYPDCGCNILHDVSLQLNREEWWQITGESGSGKTLFMRCIAGLVPSHGKLSLHGKSIQTYSLPEWRRKVLFVGSKPMPFADTIGESIKLPFLWRECPCPPEDKITKSLLDASLKFDLNATTKTLSDGERVRLAVVVATLLQPEVLLLDETLAPLDQENAKNTIAMIRSTTERSGTAVVWVDHGHRLTGVEETRKLAIVKT